MTRLLAATFVVFVFASTAFANTREMLHALHAGDIDAMRAALEAGANPDGASPFIGPGAMHLPVYIAAKAGRADILALLIEFGADIDKRDDQGRRGLDAAAGSGDLAIVRLLVEAGATPDPREDDPEVRWPLIIASDRGRVEVALFLLDRGATPDPGSARWGAPLLHAAGLGDTRLAARLIEAGVPLVPRDRLSRDTPLHRAAERSTPEMVRLLIEAGVPLDARDWRGETPLFQAAHLGRHEIVAMLVEAGAGVDIRDDEGRSPLVAALTNRPGLEWDQEMDDPFTSTRDIVVERWSRWADRDFEAVARLLAQRTQDLDTALAEAVWGGWEEAARILVAREALVNGRTLDGRATLAGSFLHPGLGMFDFLMEHHVDRIVAGAETIVAAAAAGRMDIARALFARRWRVDAPDRQGWTALLSAAAWGRVETAAELHALGADPAVRAKNGDGIVEIMEARLAWLICLAEDREASAALKPTDRIRGEAQRLLAAYGTILRGLGMAEAADGLAMPAELRGCGHG